LEKKIPKKSPGKQPVPKAAPKQVPELNLESIAAMAEDDDPPEEDFTEDDMNDPELLAQLQGLETTHSESKEDQLKHLKEEINKKRRLCVQVKREGKIPEAQKILQEIKFLEEKIADLETTGDGGDESGKRKRMNTKKYKVKN